jgi:hypothetical protein
VATIITVHGTNATGPEEGDAWWQKGSEFESDVRRCVESEDGPLAFEPFAWDGLNSETSRRGAGRRLYDRMAALEGQGKPYAVLGHSHGGSVIAAALLRSAVKKQPLSKLSAWLTVGTPFVQLKRAGLLFSRLGLLGKSAYVALVMFWLSFPALVFVMAHYFLTNPSAFDAHPDREVQNIALIVISLVGLVIVVLGWLPFFALYLVLRANANRFAPHFSKRRLAFCSTHLAQRWLAFNHRDDEAILGLKSLKIRRFNLFPADFAVAPLSQLSVFIWPLLLLVLAATPPVGAYLDRLSPGAAQYTESIPVVRHFIQLVMLPTQWRPASLSAPWMRDLWLVTVVPLVLVASCMVVVVIGTAIATVVSRIASRLLDRVTWSQIQRTSIGGDAAGEYFDDIRPAPAWEMVQYATLPQPIADEMSTVSDRDAAASLSRFRRTLNDFAFSESGPNKADALGQYLSFNELVHTAYFRVPRFRKLVCYALARSPGFRASAAFKSDPDFPLLARWLDEMRAHPEAAAAPAQQPELAAQTMR